jgi:hypothetical protein
VVQWVRQISCLTTVHSTEASLQNIRTSVRFDWLTWASHQIKFSKGLERNLINAVEHRAGLGENGYRIQVYKLEKVQDMNRGVTEAPDNRSRG